MLNAAKYFSISALATFLVSSTAHAEVEYIWDNIKGFDSAKECQVAHSSASRFRISKHLEAGGTSPFEHVYSESGRHYSYLLDNSLVRIADPDEKKGNLKIEVIGVSPNPKVDAKRGFLEWKDQGYFNPQGLKDLTGYLIEVRELSPAFKKTIGDTGENAAGTIWQAARDKDQYVTFHCGLKVYLAFDVFRGDKADPIARVGVNLEEFAIFRSVQIHQMSEAERAAKIKPEVKLELKRAVKTDVKPEAAAEAKPDVKVDVKPEAPSARGQIMTWLMGASTKEVTKSEAVPPPPLPESPPTVEAAATPPAAPAPVPAKPHSQSISDTPHAQSLAGPLNVSMAATLFGTDKIPRLSHGDSAYSRPHRGQNSSECRSAWKMLRQQKVQVQAVGIKLDTLIKKAQDMGVSPAHLKKTLGVFLANQGQIPDQRYISIIDFNKRSDKKRLFILDLKDGDVSSFPVAAGQGSDPDGDGYSTIFTNDFGTHTSSLGCYMVAGEFQGKHGLAMMLHGLESTNDYACERTVEFHTETYVGDLPGRSWGCFAIRPGDKKEIYPRVRSGLICAYKDGKIETVAKNRESNGRSSHHRRRR